MKILRERALRYGLRIGLIVLTIVTIMIVGAGSRALSESVGEGIAGVIGLCAGALVGWLSASGWFELSEWLDRRAEARST